MSRKAHHALRRVTGLKPMKEFQDEIPSGPVCLDTRNNNILISVAAKPGAKKNNITGVYSEGVGVQINASPSEGQANNELLKYMVSVLGLKKNEISIDKGSRSRSKILRITANTTVKEILEKIESEIKASC